MVWKNMEEKSMAYITMRGVGEHSGQHIAMECMSNAMIVQ